MFLGVLLQGEEVARQAEEVEELPEEEAREPLASTNRSSKVILSRLRTSLLN